MRINANLHNFLVKTDNVFQHVRKCMQPCSVWKKLCFTSPSLYYNISIILYIIYKQSFRYAAFCGVIYTSIHNIWFVVHFVSRREYESVYIQQNYLNNTISQLLPVLTYLLFRCRHIRLLRSSFVTATT